MRATRFAQKDRYNNKCAPEKKRRGGDSVYLKE